MYNGRVSLYGHIQLLTLHGLQMLYRHFQDIGFFEFGMAGGLKNKYLWKNNTESNEK